MEPVPKRRPLRAVYEAAERLLPRLLGSYRALSVMGVLAATVIFVCTNILVVRHYTRWDVTTSKAYTLSEATQRILRELDQPVEVAVLLSRSDPLLFDVRQMLSAYRAESTRVVTRFVDPDRNPAEFLALQQKYEIVTGKTQDGRVVTDASIIVSSGSEHWYITADDVLSYTDAGEARPKLEQSLTEGIANVLQQEKLDLCFTTGHREISIDDGGPNGLFELRQRLTKSNLLVRSVNLTENESLDGCTVVVVAGPELPFEAQSSSQIERFLAGGGNGLFLLNPLLNDQGEIIDSGLESVLRARGIELGHNYVIERDPARRLSQGIGEAFLATPKPHDITRGLSPSEERVLLRVLLVAPQSVRPLPPEALDSTLETPQILLTSSDRSFTIDNLSPLSVEGESLNLPEGETERALSLAVVSQKKSKARNAARGAVSGSRVVVAGTANLAWSRNFQDPTLLGTRLFVENSLAYLTERAALVSVPEKPAHAVGLNLTEESLAEVLRYVLLYMPGTALLLGLFVMLRRRSVERRSRARSTRRPSEEAGS